MPVFDLHCDTLTAFMSPLRCRDTLDDPCSAFALSKVQTIPWCQCCAVFVPDGLTPQEALGYYRYHRRSFQRQLLDRACQASACTTEEDVTAAWEQKKTALVLTVENGSLLGAGLEHVEELRRDGVRMVTLSWNGENALGSGHETDHGLTPLGKEAVRALEEAGLSIPEDVSLVSFNDTPLSELVTPALTSVSTHVEEMSRTAVRLLAERARVPGRPPVRTLPVKVVVPPSLVCRESVGVPAK